MFIPFGIPFLLSVPRKNTNHKQLMVAIWGSLKRYFNLQMEKNPSSATLLTRPTALFTLKYLEGARINTPVEGVDSDQPLDFDYSVVISADWEPKEIESFFGEGLEKVELFCFPLQTSQQLKQQFTQN